MKLATVDEKRKELNKLFESAQQLITDTKTKLKGNTDVEEVKKHNQEPDWYGRHTTDTWT